MQLRLAPRPGPHSAGDYTLRLYRNEQEECIRTVKTAEACGDEGRMIWFRSEVEKKDETAVTAVCNYYSPASVVVVVLVVLAERHIPFPSGAHRRKLPLIRLANNSVGDIFHLHYPCHHPFLPVPLRR